MNSRARLLHFFGLGAISLVFAYVLVSGLSTGAIDGPSRGNDLIKFAEHPYWFCAMALVYFFVSAVAGVGAWKALGDCRYARKTAHAAV